MDPNLEATCVATLTQGQAVCVNQTAQGTCLRQIDACQIRYGQDGMTCPVAGGDAACSTAKGMTEANCASAMKDDARNPFGARTMWRAALDAAGDEHIRDTYTREAEQRLAAPLGGTSHADAK